ncbi:uncharacterized protein N7503_000618 [Penicillium pulvis]|uniref:uncharacterized protein n=1 Tax=Penicillium pulvis TaxID=1562058 RepID=UPI002548B89D|nr:uncharacterized protein N7503_000618 [Penicillium pulvis]KAJ5813868.1 hypothetical protein N7503_000618 [Penicillium pulvis]
MTSHCHAVAQLLVLGGDCGAELTKSCIFFTPMSAPFTPPPGPPPPSLPEGWKAQYDERYQSWFFVNLITGKSQWERPETPAPSTDGASSELPPSYDNAGSADPAALANAGDQKRPLASNNPYNPTTSSRGTASPMIDDDARLAAKLQAEEDARASSGSRGPGTPGAAADFYSGQNAPQSTGSYASEQIAGGSAPEQKSRSRGFLSKLMGKSSSSSRPPQQSRPQYASYPQQPPPNAGYGRYPQQQAPGYGYQAAGYGGYPSQGGYYQQQPQQKHGMGTAGAAALGVGGGLLGGLLIADAVEGMEDHHDYDNGGYGGDDYGGGGGGGGDFGGGGFDDGGGDFGGGDF